MDNELILEETIYIYRKKTIIDWLYEIMVDDIDLFGTLVKRKYVYIENK